MHSILSSPWFYAVQAVAVLAQLYYHLVLKPKTEELVDEYWDYAVNFK